MTTLPASTSIWRAAACGLGVAVLYAVTAHFSLWFAIPPGYATAVWPPAGVALALVLAWGRPAVAGVWLGAATANFLMGRAHGGVAVTVAAAAAGIGMASALQAVATAWLLRRFLSRPLALVADRDILLFTPLVAAGCLVACSLAVVWLRFLGLVDPGAMPLNWFTWWVGDAAGALVVAPLAFTWVCKPRAVWAPRRWTVGLPLVVGGTWVVVLFRWLATDTNRAVVLIGGFLVVSLLGAVLLLLTGRAWQVEAEVAGRTAQLTELNAVLEARRAEEERMKEVVRTLNRDLELRVAERTADLEAARIEAEAANRAKGVFLAHMGHEVRTPMNGVLGMAEVLGNSPLDPRQQEWLDALKESAAALARMLDDLIDLARIEAGGMAMEALPFCPCAELEAALGPLARRAGAKGLALHHEADPQVPARVVGDAFRFRQIVFHLADNAVKFTGHGSVSVRMEARPGGGEGVVLRLIVADTGPGVPMEQMGRIFSPFARADTVRARNDGGPGLGLPICWRLAVRMGGGIAVENRAGGGAVFIATLAFGRETGMDPVAA